MVTMKTGTLARMAEKSVCSREGSIRVKRAISASFGENRRRLPGSRRRSQPDDGKPRKKRAATISSRVKRVLPVILHLEETSATTCRSFGSVCPRPRRRHLVPAVEEAIGMLSSSGAIENAKQYGVQLIERSWPYAARTLPRHEETD
jgi:hypothetical protein